MLRFVRRTSPRASAESAPGGPSVTLDAGSVGKPASRRRSLGVA